MCYTVAFFKSPNTEILKFRFVLDFILNFILSTKDQIFPTQHKLDGTKVTCQLKILLETAQRFKQTQHFLPKWPKLLSRAQSWNLLGN